MYSNQKLGRALLSLLAGRQPQISTHAHSMELTVPRSGRSIVRSREGKRRGENSQRPSGSSRRLESIEKGRKKEGKLIITMIRKSDADARRIIIIIMKEEQLCYYETEPAQEE